MTLRTFSWIFFVAIFAYIAVVIYSYPHYQEQRLTKTAVAKIESQRLTANDVSGEDLPPAPEKLDDAVSGVDTNGNGIRDDVELAIFAAYPTSTAARAAELQYAMELQTLITNVFNTDTWKAAAFQADRGYQCIASTYPEENGDLEQVSSKRVSEVEQLEFNTASREGAKDLADRFTTTYALPSGDFCDVPNIQ